MIKEKLASVFDFVGVIDVTRYPNYQKEALLAGFKSIFVVGLAYSNLTYSHQSDAFLASMYTYGLDYHDVIRRLAQEVLKGEDYQVLVDNHQLNERKALELTGLAYWAKNDLMISKQFGSYFFIGLVLTPKRYPEVIVENDDSCGDCQLCIEACPVNALRGGFKIAQCLSALNQKKGPLSELTIKKNYLLLGCDICQRVCPKNRGIVNDWHHHFKKRETTYVLIADLFNLSNKQFNLKYGKHAYLWKGKTLLLRNALTLLLKTKNTNYNEQIKKTIADQKYPKWYKEDALKILKRLES